MYDRKNKLLFHMNTLTQNFCHNTYNKMQVKNPNLTCPDLSLVFIRSCYCIPVEKRLIRPGIESKRPKKYSPN